MENIRVLVVDDESGMRQGVVRVLRDYTTSLPEADGEVEFVVDCAESGEVALEMIQSNPPEVLLLDHKLGGMSGLDVLDRVAAMDSDMVIVMITAYATLETAVSATKRGAYDFLAKPFTPTELRNIVRKAAGRALLLQQSRRLAQEKRRVRFEFISVLAHELKSPLAAVEGYLRILKTTPPGESQDTVAHMIDRCLIRSEQMRKLIIDLLDSTRIESGQKVRNLVDMDLREIARDTLAGCTPDAEARNISLELDAPEPVLIHADEDEMRIVLNNLVSNAIKYNHDSGRVDVRLRVTDQEVTISVKDTGIGMTEEEASKLFQEFVRIKNDKTRQIQGSGLGLSIVKKLAQLYGGDASVESKPGEGSVFTVVLKCAGGKK